ncbi:uncharacterized protein TNCV_4121361 [Trichonephila clavipes]|nr:uncharacterized protein TNCV_4121361 [Trichonephila clavipes]
MSSSSLGSKSRGLSPITLVLPKRLTLINTFTFMRIAAFRKPYGRGDCVFMVMNSLRKFFNRAQYSSFDSIQDPSNTRVNTHKHCNSEPWLRTPELVSHSPNFRSTRCQGFEPYRFNKHRPSCEDTDLASKERVAAVAEWYRYRIVAGLVTSSSPEPLKTRRVGQRCTLNLSRAETRPPVGVVVRRRGASSGVVHVTSPWFKIMRTATAGSDVVQSGRPIFDDFFRHLWPYIGNNTAMVQMVKRLWLIRIDQ